MEVYVLVRFNRNSGKIDTTLEGIGKGMLKMWGLHNTTKTKDTIIFNKETGEVITYYEGSSTGVKVTKDFEKHIDSYCKGLLQVVNE